MTGQNAAERATTFSRVRVKALALLTGITCVLANAVSLTSGVGDAHSAPVGAVIGQQLWNAAQVGLLLLLLCMWCVGRRWWVVLLSVAALLALPFGIYVGSPGGWILAALLLLICGAAWSTRVPDLCFTLTDEPARSAPLVTRFEFLAFVCTLFCSMYNFQVNGSIWPHWGSVYASVASMIGFTPDVPTVARSMYTLSLEGVVMPPYVPIGNVATGNLGAVVFLLIWTVLPFLYVLYFCVLAKLAKDSPGTRLQLFLCACCIVHFLFLTDFVDYKFGRGFVNPLTQEFHWTERLAWRIAILLPIYQKVLTGYFRQGAGLIGVVLHYAIACWGLFFMVYYVLLVDVPGIYEAAFDHDVDLHRLIGVPFNEALGYYGALVLMTFVYAFTVLFMPSKRICVIDAGSAERQGAGTP